MHAEQGRGQEQVVHALDLDVRGIGRHQVHLLAVDDLQGLFAEKQPGRCYPVPRGW